MYDRDIMGRDINTVLNHILKSDRLISYWKLCQRFI